MAELDGTRGLTLFVNGERRELTNVDPEQTLLEYLRAQGLTGTKLGCGEGGCGSCTVVCSRRASGKVHHFSINACLATICEMDGTHITTVEGLANADAGVLHPISKAISDSHGSQCGYCTPGIIMSMYGLWVRGPFDVADIEHRMDGNLCRCTGYRPILQALHPMARDFGRDGEELSCCGHRIPASLGSDSVQFGEQVQARLEAAEELLKDSRRVHVSGSHLGRPTEWCSPESLEETLDIVSKRESVRFQVGNSERRIEKIFKANYVQPSTLLSLTRVAELQGISWSSSEVRLGAAVPLQLIAEAFRDASAGYSQSQLQVVQAYSSILQWFAGHQIRNVATLGGNIATASPISDLNPCHVAAGATLEVASIKNGSVTTRRVPMGDNNRLFFTGYRVTALDPKEVVVAVCVPLTRDGEYFQAFKQSRRRDDDLAIVNAGMRVLFVDGVVAESSFVFGGMAPHTKVCIELEKWWTGRQWTRACFQDSLAVLSRDVYLPDGSPGGMCEYRRSLAQSFYFKFWASVAHALGETIPQRELSAVQEHTTSTNYHRPAIQGLQHFGNQDTLSSPPTKHMACDMQVSGQAKYTDDVPVTQGEVFMDFVLSTKAHARILGIDSSRAKEVEGFVDLITAQDIRGENLTGPISHDEEALASKEVHCVGAVVAVVCATSRGAARVAARAVTVEYEELPYVCGLKEAIDQGSFFPLNFQQPGDVTAEIHTVDTSRGAGMDAIISSSRGDGRFHVIEGETFIGGQEHFYLETMATRVEPKENGEYLITSSTQNVHETQLLCARALGTPLAKVTCQVKRLGGGFGGKETRSCVLAIAAAVAAQKLRRPVRFHMDRDVDQVTSGQRHSALARYHSVVEKDSLKVIAADVELYINGGWSLDLSQPVLNRAMLHITNAYHIPNIRVRGRVCRTNLPSNTAFRGFGGPQGMYVAEVMCEHAASVLGVSREEVLHRNLLRDGDITHYGWELQNVHLERMWEQITQNFDARRRSVEAFNAEHRYLKRGIAILPTAFGISFTAPHMNQGGALVHIQKDGSVLVAHGGVEMGQGLHTKIARIAASTLGLPIEAVYVKETTTDCVANSLPTAASSGTDIYGAAVQNACLELHQRLKPFLEKHEGSPQEIMAKAAVDAFMARVNLSAQGFHRTDIAGCDWNQSGVNEFRSAPFWYMTYGIACSEVQIDCLTGDMVVLRSDIVHDVGNSVNPALDIGQIEGAFIQGVGYCTIEETVYDLRGNLLSKGPGAYKIPGFGDIPLDFRVHLLDGSRGVAVFGSKAVGEPPFFLGLSVFWAVKDAVIAARKDHSTEGSKHFRFDAPATPEKIRMACLDFINPSGQVTSWHAHA
mmetsp:Transcript_48329/g.127956  ORF Transcript_48329/g.127956 Transcript_48329/m.127956 type:complete len:1342 (-) Transcript_48329:125-4150(-)